MRALREKYAAEIIPNLLINSCSNLCIGGDLNSIIDKKDATKNANAKISPSFRRLVSTFSWTDSFRALHPNQDVFSHYYSNNHQGVGATRIDRMYHCGQIKILRAEYIPIAFSDHMGLRIDVNVPSTFSHLKVPQSLPLFKANPDIVKSCRFKQDLKENMDSWQNLRLAGVHILPWWEYHVKPGIKKLLLTHTRDLAKQRGAELNLLLLKQSYFTRKVQNGQLQRLGDLKIVQSDIEKWYDKQSEKILLQSRNNEIQVGEKVCIFHHNLHKKSIKKSSILKLQTLEGEILGHDACAQYLENSVAKLLLNPVNLDTESQHILLKEVKSVFTESDNNMLLTTPSKGEIKQVLSETNLHAAPGTDGLTFFFYKECWDIMGDSLTEIIREIFKGSQPTKSQRTSLMVFGCKPKKVSSIKPEDKRKISLLNADFKLITGIQASRLKKVATHTLSSKQLVAGNNRRIYHGINAARDAIWKAGSAKMGCGIVDNDYKAAFDYLVMTWVFKVLLAKGLDPKIIDHLKNLYMENITVVVVNNKMGRAFSNNRMSLRQGDLPSMFWFAYAIDPLLLFLDSRLKGIPVFKLLVSGPVQEGENPLPPLEEKYTVVSYADDVKSSVTNLEEFLLVDYGSALFEKSSGCLLHRDPNSGKCKVLLLGKWRQTIKQEDIPLDYIKVSDHLDMLGVVLKATNCQTRMSNGDELVLKVKNKIGSWQTGKFMPITQRPFSINSFVLSKTYFRCNSLDLRIKDISAITTSVKSWLYKDQLEKPEEIVLHRPITHGGLGLDNVRFKATARLINSFLETAANPKFIHSLYHQALYRYYVLEERHIADPGLPPYYSEGFFNIIKSVHHKGNTDITTMRSKEWYMELLNETLLMEEAEVGVQTLKKCKSELKNPQIDWEKSWSLARVKGLDAENISFLWKMLHDLLPTQGRISRIMNTNDPNCKLCNLEPDHLPHLFNCSFSKDVCQALLQVVRSVSPDVNPSNILFLSLDLDMAHRFPTIWFISSTLAYVWSQRSLKKISTLVDTRAMLEARVNILRKSRNFVPDVAIIEDYMINFR